MPDAETPTVAPLIELHDIVKRFTQGELTVEVLHGISLSIWAGEFVAIMGASGSGKTTLMNIIGCMDRPSAGRYLLAGRDVAELDADALAQLRRSTFGFIFQRYNLLSNATALENVEVPAIYAGLPAAARRERAKALLTRLGLGERLDYPPSRLSGGQQQRVSIARALMNGGRVILADEPTGALDTASGKEVMALLHELHREGHTVVVITHDPNVAREAQRIIRIQDGRIVEDSGPAPEAVEGRVPTLPLAEPPREGHAVLMLDVAASVRTALRALQANPLRTLLTLLGVMIGVGSVVAMLAFGNGARQKVLDQIQAMGTNLLVVRPGAPGVRYVGSTITTLVVADAEAIARLPNVEHVVPQSTSAVTVRAGNITYTTSLTATSPEYTLANAWPVAVGTFFTQTHVQGYAPVAVLGQTTAQALFGTANPIGRYVLINNTPLRIIGVLTPKGADMMGNDRDDMVFVPLTTGQARITGQTWLRFITVEVRDTALMAATQAAIEQLLLKRHRTLDFQVRNMTALLEQQAETQQTLTLLLGAVALISLVVGGIGVMNIMLVSVTERTREIGVRMAVGARAFHILLQFVTEALVVCTVGGLIGVAGGLIVIAVAAWLGTAVLITVPPILLAFTSALATGLVFGYLPAKRAASLDPVVALSTE
ncbi:MAG: MacB family efflux pump subunit [Tepidiphilus sp.]|jgi:macrolide transport system ATP-binding/permease protein|nr:MacB family efflux pump subunit [Tepidiphilus sp.]